MSPFGSEKKNGSVVIGEVVATLFGRDGACVPVLAAADPSISPASLTSSGEWLIPCDIVGLNSKKTKTAKIRFHPNSIKRAAAGELQRAVDGLLSSLSLDGEWSEDQRIQAGEDCRVASTKLRRFFAAATAHVWAEGSWLFLSWPFHSESANCSGKASRHLRDAAALFSSAKTPFPLFATVHPGHEGHDILDVIYHKGELESTVWRMQLPSEFLLDTAEELVPFQIGERGLSVQMKRLISADEAVLAAAMPPPFIPLSLTESQPTADTKIRMSQTQSGVEELRRRLEESVIAFQKAASFVRGGVESESEGGRGVDRPRLLHLVTAPHEATIRILDASIPLAVVVAELSGGVSSRARELHGSTSELPVSPADSVDSAVSLSPSPKASPFYAYSEQSSAAASLGMRSRSLSETTMHIKGILKKNHKSRSMSECGEEWNPCMAGGGGGRWWMIDEESVEEGEKGEEEGQKGAKRVSFSESVQRRSFRPNASILGQKKKNERKARCKKRKQERRASESDFSSSQLTESDHDHSASRKEQKNAEVGEKTEEVKASMRNYRADSGFVDDYEVEGEEGEADSEGEETTPPLKTALAGDECCRPWLIAMRQRAGSARH